MHEWLFCRSLPTIAKWTERVKLANPNIFKSSKGRRNHQRRVEQKTHQLAFEDWAASQASLQAALDHPGLPPSMKDEARMRKARLSVFAMLATQAAHNEMMDHEMMGMLMDGYDDEGED